MRRRIERLGLTAALLLLAGCINDPPTYYCFELETTHGIVGYEYEVRAAFDDPEEKGIAYRVDFDDGDTSDWTGYVPSGDTGIVTHAWQQPGTYGVRLQLRDEEGFVSEWLGKYGKPEGEALQILISALDFPYRVVDTIGVGAGATGLALSPDGERLYVTCCLENVVSVVRTDGDSVVATVAVAEQPEAVAVAPSGEYVYVASRPLHEVYVIKTSDYAIVDTFRANYDPVDMAFRPDGEYLYIALRRENDVLVIRTEDRERVTMTQTARNPEDVLITRDGAGLLVACSQQDSVEYISTVTHEITSSLSTISEPVAMAVPDAGSPVYVVGRTSQLDRLVLPGYPPAGGGPCRLDPAEAVDIAVVPDGRYLYISQPELFRVAVADPEFRFVCAIPVGTEPRRMLAHPDGEKVYVADYAYGVYVLGR